MNALQFREFRVETMTYLKEWENEIEEKVINIFEKWEKCTLVIVYVKKERTVSDTYGLPYTSTRDYAGIWNTNVDVRLKSDKHYKSLSGLYGSR